MCVLHLHYVCTHTCLHVGVYDCGHYIEVVLPCEHRPSLLCTASDGVHREQAAVPRQSPAPGLLWQSLHHRRHPRPHHQGPQDQGNFLSPHRRTPSACPTSVFVITLLPVACPTSVFVIPLQSVLDGVNDKSGSDSVKRVRQTA